MSPVVVGGGELGRHILVWVTACRVGVAGWHRGRGATMVLGVVLKERVVSWGKGTKAIGIIVIGAVGVGIAVAGVAVVAAVVVATTTVGAACGLMIVHVDSLVSLVAVRSHGESSLVRVNVVAAHLTVVVARQDVVVVVVVESVERDKGCPAKEDAAELVSNDFN